VYNPNNLNDAIKLTDTTANPDAYAAATRNANRGNTNNAGAPTNNAGTPPQTITRTGTAAYNSGGLAGAIAQLSAGKPAGKDELVLYQNVAMAAGKQSGNPGCSNCPIR
jgi:molybdopterin-containing oxidoreductase family iron-sulfur binding subunit